MRLPPGIFFCSAAEAMEPSLCSPFPPFFEIPVPVLTASFSLLMIFLIPKDRSHLCPAGITTQAFPRKKAIPQRLRARGKRFFFFLLGGFVGGWSPPHLVP